MRIGIDGGSWSNRRGYGRFLREVVHAVAQIDCEHEFVIFLDERAARDFAPMPRFEVREVALSRGISEAATSDGNRTPADLLRMGRAASKEQMDVFFFPTVYSYFPLWSRISAVVGIHDTIADRNPRFAFAGRRQEFLWRAKVRAALLQARLIMTVSEYSRRCLREEYNLSDSRIRVVPEAASERFQPPPPGSVRERFVLYAGGISPNKNLGTLVRAFARLEDARQAGWRLLLAGDYQSDGFRSCFRDISALVRDCGIADQVQFLGYVPDEELAALYQRAGLFVLPSYDEGFGLPAVEAMASGAPVIVSQGNSLTEVAGEAALSFPPHDEQALAGHMQRLIADPQLREQLSRLGSQRSAEFSWSRSASILVRVLEEAAG